MIKKTAVKPTFFDHFKSIREKEIAQKAGVTEEELALYSMSKTSGWRHFENTAKNLLEELEQLNDQAILKGVPLEELGRNTIVISLTRGIIKRLLNKVYDAKEVCERK